MNWFESNKEWFFSGIGVAILTSMLRFLFSRRTDKPENSIENNITINNSNQVNSAIDASLLSPDKLSNVQNSKRILFIDDDAKFKVVKICLKVRTSRYIRGSLTLKMQRRIFTTLALEIQLGWCIT